MPYGNKDLHFGHIGGVFVQADAFCRFLKDRIGSENVVFVSGTDCFGSPAEVGYEKSVEEGTFSGSLQDFVTANHRRQLATLKDYLVEPSLFAASSLEPYVGIHQEIGRELVTKLHQNGYLRKITTLQFFDPEKGVFLNGRQVEGRCPIAGCSSEKGYADECSLGHQYAPKYLISPKSVITGAVPEMRETTSWYLDMEPFRPLLESWVNGLKESQQTRPFVTSTLEELLEPPTIHITRDQIETLDEVAADLPKHARMPGRNKALRLVFDSLSDLELAVTKLGDAGVRYRTGKSLVPFRLTGNTRWGLQAPALEDIVDVTFWVWPESLWAPISFCEAFLRDKGHSEGEWRDWWCSSDSEVFQFVGEDNINFYGHPQTALFLGQQEGSPSLAPPDGELHLTRLIANRHVLFLDKKVSSSGNIKPPMAADLLSYYTPEQLRAHFFGMALGRRSVNFRPKPLNPSSGPREPDPVLKEGNVLCNGLNRAARSCFYTAQKYFNSQIPVCEISTSVVGRCECAVLDFEALMHRQEFPQAFVTADDLVRDINRLWSEHKPYADDCEPALRAQALADAFHMVRVASLLLHPIAPSGTELIQRHLGFGPEIWSWETAFSSPYEFMKDPESHKLVELPPRFDFFPKHASQLSE